MSKLKITLRAYLEIHKLDKRMLPCCLAISIIAAILPFINIWFFSRIVNALESHQNLKHFILLIASAVVINFILVFLNHYLSDMFFMYRIQIYNVEQKNIAKKLYSIEFGLLEDSEIRELIYKQDEAQSRLLSAFVQFVWMARDFITGAITVALSIILLWPLFKIGFSRNGNSFFERPIFFITILFSVAIIAIIILLIAKKINTNQFKSENSYANLNKYFYYYLNMFKNYKTGKEIRLYNEQQLIYDASVNVLLDDGEKILRNYALDSAKSSSFIALLGVILCFGIYLFVGIKAFYGLLDLSSIVLYCGTFIQAIMGVMKLSTTFGKLSKVCPMVNYYFGILNITDKMKYGTAVFDSDQFEIEFKHVSFKYPNSNEFVIKDINLNIHNGETIAFVGKNGSGKTTLIKLLCRLYDVTDGEILINGLNIQEYSKQSILTLFSVVFQDFKIFSIPLYQNITATKDYNKKKLYQCLDEANIKERVLKMKEKEKTFIYKNIDENGIEISGGEAQKIAISRAHYKNSPIVILDEPTAALDPAAENEIYTRFNNYVNNKTCIYISHRLSSCAFCDKVAVFESGKLVEFGTPKELLQIENGKYRELWDAQAKYYF